jgi:hypothetical protein
VLSNSAPLFADFETNPRYVIADLGTNPRYVNPRYVLTAAIIAGTISNRSPTIP